MAIAPRMRANGATRSAVAKSHRKREIAEGADDEVVLMRNALDRVENSFILCDEQRIKLGARKPRST